MKSRIARVLSAAAACVSAALIGASARGEPLMFSATGCGPYAPDEEPLLAKFISDVVNKDGKSEFLVHLGDVVTGKKKEWPESQYEKVAGILKTSAIPVFVVPGDNEWNDLTDPDVGWKHWSKHFHEFEKNFKNAPALSRQKVRPENFAWVRKGVLLIGINLVGGRVHDAKEWDARMKQNVEWIRENMRLHGKEVRAAVVFAQAMPQKSIEPFAIGFGAVAKEFDKPVLYLHADGHKWQVEQGWRSANVLRVMTDQVRLGPPVLVTVTDDPAKPFEFDRRLAK